MIQSKYQPTNDKKLKQYAIKELNQGDKTPPRRLRALSHEYILSLSDSNRGNLALSVLFSSILFHQFLNHFSSIRTLIVIRG